MAICERRNWAVMGTRASLVVAGSPEQAQDGQQLAAEVLTGIELTMSSYLPESEVSRFNRNRDMPISEPLREVLAACAWLESESAGLFSMYPNGSSQDLDVAGYVKGWAVDQAASALLAAGFDTWALGVGGDWRCHGGHPDGRPWRFAVLDPRTGREGRAIVELVSGAIATSGRYERGDHVVVPPPAAQRASRTPELDSSASSFTVTGPLLAWADAFATVGLLLGDAGLTWVAGFPGYTGAVVRHDGSMLADQEMPLAATAAWRVGRDFGLDHRHLSRA